MAFIGMRHVVASVLSAHTSGSEPTYGTGEVIGKAITGNLTINRNTNPLYADDVIAEEDNGITGMELELGLDDLSEDSQAYLGLLVKKTAGTPSVTTYYETSAASNYVGVGYIRVRRKGGTTSYQAIWIYKAMFAKNSENAQTKGETIEWQTPTINGTCVGLSVDSSGDETFRKIQTFSSESAAISWLDGLANVPAA